MKIAKLLHNPKAGAREFTQEQLMDLIANGGFDCLYASAKKPDWDKIEKNVDFLIIAGGDGTVRKVAKAIYKGKIESKFPLAVLPLGTANNIATTLHYTDDKKSIVTSWHSPHIQLFDIGAIKGLEDDEFFMESFGLGIFPALINEIRTHKRDEGLSPAGELRHALELLYKIAETYPAQKCKLEVDGTKHSGKFLLLEIMNTPFIGPNLVFNPQANVGDGCLEIVLITEEQRPELLQFLEDQMDGKHPEFSFSTLKGKNIELKTATSLFHFDDELEKVKDEESVIEIKIQESALRFLVQGGT